MLERIKAVLDARKENDKGFSLVELAVVIVIIGILVAVAIPIFLGMQESAEEAAAETAVANGAAMVAAEVARSDSGSVDLADITSTLESAVGGSDVITVTPTTGITLDNYCVTSQADTTIQKGACGVGDDD